MRDREMLLHRHRPSRVYLDDDLTSRCRRHEWTYVLECPVISPRKMERDQRFHGERQYRYLEGPKGEGAASPTYEKRTNEI